MAAAKYGSLPFSEAIQYFRDKVNLPTKKWSDLTKGMHSRAFVVAGAQKSELLSDLRGLVDKSISDGQSYGDFRKGFHQAVTKAGWSYNGSFGWRSGVIYDTNMRTAYSAGRYRQQHDPDVLKAMPYLRYRALDSGNRRPEHQRWKNTVLPATDPWWDDHTPPCGWNCFLPGTPVLTDRGWRSIEEISAGNRVLGGSGNVKTVTFVHQRPFEGQILRVIVEGFGGFSLTPNHRVLTLRGWVRADGLQVGDELVQIRQAIAFNDSIAYVNESYASRDDVRVAVPIERKPPISNAMNPQSQIRDENVEPIGFDVHVERCLVPEFFNVIKQRLFRAGGRHSEVGMFRSVNQMPKSARVSNLGLNFRSSSGGRVAKFLRHLSHELGVFLSRDLPNMSTLASGQMVHLDQGVPLMSSALDVSGPLQPHRFAMGSSGDAKSHHQVENGMVPHAPSLAQPVNVELVNMVEPEEGGSGGAPLSGFDSLDDFRTWARVHCVLRRVTEIKNTFYTGNVFNLAVDEDESYCIPECVVHNCQCWTESVSKTDYSAIKDSSAFNTTPPEDGSYTWTNPSTGEKESIPDGIDPGWNYNPGKTAWGAPTTKQLADAQEGDSWTNLTTGGPSTYDRGDVPVDETATSMAAAAKTPKELRQTLRDAIGGDEAYFDNPAGDTICVNQGIVDHILEKPESRWNGREKYFPFIKELIENPYEVWISFAQNDRTGKVALRQRYVKVINTGKEKSVGLVADATNGMWTGLTTFAGNTTNLKNLRVGRLLWGRWKDYTAPRNGTSLGSRQSHAGGLESRYH